MLSEKSDKFFDTELGDQMKKFATILIRLLLLQKK